MPPISRRLLRHASLLLCVASLSLLSCGRELTGPDGARRVMHGFAFAPRFVAPSLTGGVAGQLVSFTKVRVLLMTQGNRPAVDRVVDFPSDANEVPLSLSVPLSGSAGPEGEIMDLTLAFINAQGDTVFRGGPAPVLIVASQSGSQAPPPVEIPVQYSGVGANAARVVINRVADTLVAGASFTYTAVAQDGQGNVLANTPIAWRTATPTKLTLSSVTSGSGVTLATRGAALVIAESLTGQADTVAVEILPKAQALTLVSGNNQTAALDAALPAPLVVRVDASDGLPMAGVAVTFAVTAGGGSLSQLVDTTDANGLASAVWTTTTSLAAQTVTATAGVVTGSPVTFTAQPPQLTLAFDQAPTTVSVGAVIAPAPRVSLRDGQGAIVSTFTGLVEITVAAGPQGATLGGTTSIAAVAGVATFADLTLDLIGGAYALRASAPSLGLVSANSASFAVTAGAATQLVFTQAPAGAEAGVALSPAVLVEARDGLGNLVTSFTDPVTVSFQQGAGSLLGTTTVNAVGGVATFADLSITGVFNSTQLRATATGLSAGLSAQFPVVGGPAAKLRFDVPISGLLLAGQPIGEAIAVRAYDAFDNVASSYSGTVTLSLANNPSAATLGGTVTVNAVNGLATFTGISVSAAGTGYTMQADAPGLTAGVSEPFNVNPFSLVNSWINASGGNWSDPANWSLGRVPVVSDTVVITLDGVYDVTMDVAGEAGVVLIGGGSGTQGLLLGSQSLQVSDALVIGTTAIVRLNAGSFTGAAVVENAGHLIVEGGAHGFALINAGRLTLQGNTTFSGALSTEVTSLVEVESRLGLPVAQVTVTNGFTNHGLLDFLVANDIGGARFTIGGPLVNAADGTIRVFGSPGIVRTLRAEVTNDGTIAVDATVILETPTPTGAQVNRGAITLAIADMQLVQPSGGTFTHTGTITLAASRQFGVTGGSASLVGGTVSGYGGSLFTSSTTLSFENAAVRTRLEMYNTVISNPLTVAAGDSLRLVGGSSTMDLTNAGRVVLEGVISLGGTLTTVAGSVLEIRSGAGSPSAAVVNIANGFTNHGLIELLAQGWTGTQMTVGGTLLNAADGTIRATGWTSVDRALQTSLENDGAIIVEALLQLQTPTPTGTQVNRGSIAASAAFIVSQPSAGTFTHTGTWTIADGINSGIVGGTASLIGGTVTGYGGLLFANGTTLNFENAAVRTRLELASVTVPGTFTVAAGDSLRLVGGSPTMTLTNAGRVVLEGAAQLGGTLTTLAGSVLEVRSSAGSPSAANASVVNGFTNHGFIDLVAANGWTGTRFTVGGTLLNAADGTIRSSGWNNLVRTLRAVVENDGALLVDAPLQLETPTATGALVNRATIALNVGSLIVLQSAGGSFTHTGTATLADGTQLYIDGGTASLIGGTVSGYGASLYANGTVLSFDNAAVRTRLELPGVTVPGAFTVAAGDSLRLVGGSPTMTLTNAGRVVLEGAAQLGGSLTTLAGSVLEVRSSAGSPSAANASVVNGFTNHGLIDLVATNGWTGTRFTVGGTLLNAADGTIRATGWNNLSRTLNADVTNDGAIIVDTPLRIETFSVGGAQVNRGSIALNLADLEVAQPGDGTFTHTGAMTLAPGRTVYFLSGAVDVRLGSISGGEGVVVSQNTTSFQLAPATFQPRLAIGGTLSSPTPLTIAATDSLRILGGTLAPGSLSIDGTLILESTTTVSAAALSINPGGLLLVRSSDVGGVSVATFTSAVTSNGIIRLTNTGGARSTSLSLGTNALTLGATGALELLAGSGGDRAVSAGSIDNNGAITVTATSVVSGPIAQRNLMNVAAGATLTLQNPLTLFNGSNTSVLGTLTLNGGCVISGVPIFSGFACP